MRLSLLLAYQGTLYGGKGMPGKKFNVPARAHPLVASLFEKMYDQKISVVKMADISGVGVNALTDWRYRTNPTVPNLDACLNVVGYKLVVVPIEKKET